MDSFSSHSHQVSLAVRRIDMGEKWCSKKLVLGLSCVMVGLFLALLHLATTGDSRCETG